MIQLLCSPPLPQHTLVVIWHSLSSAYATICFCHFGMGYKHIHTYVLSLSLSIYIYVYEYIYICTYKASLYWLPNGQFCVKELPGRLLVFEGASAENRTSKSCVCFWMFYILVVVPCCLVCCCYFLLLFSFGIYNVLYVFYICLILYISKIHMGRHNAHI